MNTLNKHRQAGFTIWELLLLIIILILLILAGWYVWNANKTKDDAKQEASQSQDASKSDGSDEEEETKDPTEDWLLFTAPNEWYTVRIPDGWNPTVNTSSSVLYCIEADECLAYVPGEKASVEQTNADFGANFAFLLKPVGPDAGEDEEIFFQNYEQTGTLKTTNVTGNTYKRTLTEDQPLGPQAGDTQYGYAFTKGDHNILVTYTVKQGQPGDLATVETMLKTLQLQ